jgi:hypothetical protein
MIVPFATSNYCKKEQKKMGVRGLCTDSIGILGFATKLFCQVVSNPDKKIETSKAVQNYRNAQQLLRIKRDK